MSSTRQRNTTPGPNAGGRPSVLKRSSQFDRSSTNASHGLSSFGPGSGSRAPVPFSNHPTSISSTPTQTRSYTSYPMNTPNSVQSFNNYPLPVPGPSTYEAPPPYSDYENPRSRASIHSDTQDFEDDYPFPLAEPSESAISTAPSSARPPEHRGSLQGSSIPSTLPDYPFPGTSYDPNATFSLPTNHSVVPNTLRTVPRYYSFGQYEAAQLGASNAVAVKSITNRLRSISETAPFMFDPIAHGLSCDRNGRWYADSTRQTIALQPTRNTEAYSQYLCGEHFEKGRSFNDIAQEDFGVSNWEDVTEKMMDERFEVVDGVAKPRDLSTWNKYAISARDQRIKETKEAVSRKEAKTFWNSHLPSVNSEWERLGDRPRLCDSRRSFTIPRNFVESAVSEHTNGELRVPAIWRPTERIMSTNGELVASVITDGDIKRGQTNVKMTMLSMRDVSNMDWRLARGQLDPRHYTTDSTAVGSVVSTGKYTTRFRITNPDGRTSDLIFERVSGT